MTTTTKTQSVSKVLSRQGFVVEANPIEGIHLRATVEFEDGTIGLVWAIEDTMRVLLLNDSEKATVGSKLKPLHRQVAIDCGEHLLGQTVDSLARPLDAKTKATAGQALPVFNLAPSFYERAVVDAQLETSVSLVDTLFPIVKGQRIAVLGDAKSGKTTFLSQAAIHQAQNDCIIIYVVIAKAKHSVEKLKYRLYQSGALKNTVIVVADSFDALPLSFLAPYTGCTIGEWFWHTGRDVVVIYDDLSNHAKIYRELSLLLRTNPGREGYPGNMFYTHSSLLERAGKFKKSGFSQTVLAAGTTPNGDITGYFPTNLISMTDGQIVFDLETMRKGIKPAVNIGLSVSRVGGRSQEPEIQELSARVMEVLAGYRQASSFARFGSQLSEVAAKQLKLGAKLYELFAQAPDQAFSLAEQRVMLETIFLTNDIDSLNVGWLKSVIHDVVKYDLKTTSDYKALAKELIKSNPVVK
ncbi:sodium-transporting two-sector ATPase [Candidatus Saccharibacteria bacterium]|nr:sodium-transporting two-sector ATPase [Candidatus Saccharibacteria bacterium]